MPQRYTLNQPRPNGEMPLLNERESGEKYLAACRKQLEMQLSLVHSYRYSECNELLHQCVVRLIRDTPVDCFIITACYLEN